MFREIALSVINSDCINEPLQSTVKEMSGASSDKSSYDDKYGYEDYKVILVTGAICFAITFLVLGAVWLWKKRQLDLEKQAVLSTGSNNDY